MLERLLEFSKDEEGQALAETAMVLALVFLVCIVVVTQFGGRVQGFYQDFVAAYPAWTVRR